MKRARAVVVLVLLAGAASASFAFATACSTRLVYSFDGGPDGGGTSEAGAEAGPSGAKETHPHVFVDLLAMLSYGNWVFFAHKGGISACAKPACDTLQEVNVGSGAGTGLTPGETDSVFGFRGQSLVKCDVPGSVFSCNEVKVDPLFAAGTPLLGDTQSFVWRRPLGNVLRVRRPPGAAVEQVLTTPAKLELALVSNSLYVTHEDNGSFFVFDMLAEQGADAGSNNFVFRILFDRGKDSTFERPRGIAVMNDALYVAVAGTPGKKNGYFFQCASNKECETANRTIPASLDDPTGFLVDPEVFYWTEGSLGSVHRLSRSKANLEPPIATGLRRPRLLTGDEKQLYVAVDGDSPGASKIVRITK